MFRFDYADAQVGQPKHAQQCMNIDQEKCRRCREAIVNLLETSIAQPMKILMEIQQH